MKRMGYIIFVIALAMFTAPVIAATSVGTPTIDGVINAGEWPDKISITLNGYDQPSNLKYGDLYVMNDANNIYVAVVIPDTKEDSDYLMLDFDNGNDHMATNGKEDAARFNVAHLYGGTTGYLDYYWDGNWWAQDFIKHGAGAMTFSNGKYSYEFSKPLNSGDIQDMSLHPGDTVGFRIETWDGTLNDWYRYPQNTVDAETSGWAYWDNLKIEVTANAPVITSITVSPASIWVVGGNTLTFTATPKDQSGDSITVTVTWSSSNTTVGTITQEGLFTAVANGTTTVTAIADSIVGSATVRVGVNLVDTYLPPEASPAERKAGLIRAMDDYFDNGTLTKPELLSVLDAYFA